MQFIDLHTQYRRIQKKVDEAVLTVMRRGQFILGPEVTLLEEYLAKFVGVKHCISVSSGTTALQMALMAIGIEPGDEVITPGHGFFVAPEVILLLGATPVFVDIDPRTYNLDPDLIESAITNKTKAILPVSLYGQCADMDAINAIAQRYELPVIEDAAQSFGALYRGRRSCELSTIGCTSFFPSKPLGCYGDGGACFTNDDIFAEHLRLIRKHGQLRRHYHIQIGLNGRLDTIQAAVLLAKLDIFEDELRQRQQVANWYNEKLKQWVTIPYIEPYSMSSYAQYTIQVQSRDQVQAALKALDIPTAVHYPMPLNKQPAFQNCFKKEMNCFNADAISKTVLSLPFHPYLSRAEVDRVSCSLISELEYKMSMSV